MGRKSIDFSKVTEYGGNLYIYDERLEVERRLTTKEIRAYRTYQNKGVSTSRRAKISSNKFIKTYFNRGLKANTKQGHLKSWLRPLTVSGGKGGGGRQL